MVAFEQLDEFVKLKQNVTRTMVDSADIISRGSIPDYGKLQDY